MDSVWFSRPPTQQPMNEMRHTGNFQPASYNQPPRMRQIGQNHPPHRGFSRPSYPPVMGRGPIPDHRGMRMPSHGEQHQRTGPPSFHMQPHMLPPGPMMAKQQQQQQQQQQHHSPNQMGRPGGVHPNHRSDAAHHHFHNSHAAPGRNPELYQRPFQRQAPHHPGPMQPPPMHGLPPHRIPSNPIPCAYPGPRNLLIPIPGSPASNPSRSPGPSPPPPPPPPPPPQQQHQHQHQEFLSFPPTARQLRASYPPAFASAASGAPLRESRSQNVQPAEVASAAPTPKTPTSSEQQEQEQQPHQQQQPQVQPPQNTSSSTTVKFEALQDAASILLELRSSSSPPTLASEDQQSDDGSTDINNEQREEEEEMRCNDDYDGLEPPSMDAPKSFPSRLSLPGDESWLNSLHCFLRSELLEVFVVEKSQTKSPTHSPGSSVGRVGLRCVHCALARKKSVGQPSEDRCEAPMAVFYPKCISEIYRLVTSWQRCHLRKCRNLPPDVRAKWTILRETDKSRGKTQYWVTSAKEIGLVDCSSRAGGVRFALEEERA